METLDVAAPTVAPDSAHQHADAHSHAGGHTNAHDYAKANESHFDHEAQLQGNFVQSKWIELSKKLGTTMVARYPALFQKVSTSVLDFACGPGWVSGELYPHVKSILGVDISQGMVDKYNTRAVESGISPENMHAVRAELKGDSDAVAQLGGRPFDVVVCTVAYHHIADIHEMTRILASCLAPGGSLLVMDWLRSPEVNAENPLEEMMAKYKDINPHRGFTEQEIRDVFDSAGMDGFEFNAAGEFNVFGHDMVFFLARGVKT